MRTYKKRRVGPLRGKKGEEKKRRNLPSRPQTRSKWAITHMRDDHGGAEGEEICGKRAVPVRGGAQTRPHGNNHASTRQESDKAP